MHVWMRITCDAYAPPFPLSLGCLLCARYVLCIRSIYAPSPAGACIHLCVDVWMRITCDVFAPFPYCCLLFAVRAFSSCVHSCNM